MALLCYQMEKITLGITIQSTLYTDARRPMMPQRSGGLENSKSFQQTKKTFINQKHRTHYFDAKDFKLCIFRKHKDICSSLSGLKRGNKSPKKYCSRRGNRHFMQATFLELSRETFSVILKRTEHNNGICQSLPNIKRKRDAIASLSHITNMTEMNKSNKVITYIPSDLPLRMFLLLEHYD